MSYELLKVALSSAVQLKFMTTMFTSGKSLLVGASRSLKFGHPFAQFKGETPVALHRL